MKAFAHYVQYRNPEYLENCTDIIAMRPKKHEKPVTPFLTEEELKALLTQPDPSTRYGLTVQRGGAMSRTLSRFRLRSSRTTSF